MALQLTGAFKRDALPNLQVRLPAIVIGGGLTAIDTATELMAYYPVQVEKTLDAVRGARRRARRGSACARRTTPRSASCSTSICAHGRAVRAERARAAEAGEAPDFIPLVRGWGGVTIVYRKRMVDSPAYRLNHEEVIKALEEGHHVRREPEPGRSAARRERRAARGDLQARSAEGAGRAGRPSTLPARTMLRRGGDVAEHHLREGSARDVRARREEEVLPAARRRRRTATARSTLVPDADGFFTSYDADGRFVTLLRRQPSALRRQRRQGDGVGEARLSARDARCSRASSRRSIRRGSPERDAAWRQLTATLDDELLARVVEVVRLTPTIVEVDRAGAGGGAALPAGAVLPAAELRVDGARGAGGVPLLMEGHRAHRRVGRQASAACCR